MYDIMILWKAADTTQTITIETDIETILDNFGNDPTLTGTAFAGVLPSTRRRSRSSTVAAS